MESTSIRICCCQRDSVTRQQGRNLVECDPKLTPRRDEPWLLFEWVGPHCCRKDCHPHRCLSVEAPVAALSEVDE